MESSGPDLLNEVQALLKILYIGPDEGTSRQRFEALRRLGHEVVMVDPFAALSSARYIRTWIFHTGAVGCEWLVQSYVAARIGDLRFDVALVDNGELIGPALVRHLKDHAKAVVVYTQDNPFVAHPSGRRRFRLLRRALPFYDLFVTPRDSNVADARASGARNVLRVMFAADEVVHRPRTLSQEDQEVYASEVVFAGTWKPERGPLLQRLVDRGVPLRIFGPRWDRAREYPVLRSHVHLGSLGDEEYAKAIAGAKIAIGLLSKAYLDLHTTRSLEIPAIRTLLCAQRTSDHLALYRDGEEAVFWDDAEECAKVCLELLKDPERIRRIAEAGYRRAHVNRHFNQDLLTRILKTAITVSAERSPVRQRSNRYSGSHGNEPSTNERLG
jgi:spore maturation protein CgeB